MLTTRRNQLVLQLATDSSAVRALEIPKLASAAAITYGREQAITGRPPSNRCTVVLDERRHRLVFRPQA
jgi:hypothetical protein